MRLTSITLLLAATASATVDPGAGTAPRTEFEAPRAGTYELQRIQNTADATLLDTGGRNRHLSQYTHGKVTLLTFFYTECPDPLGCPFGYVILSQLRARILERAELVSRVRFVSVSLDPATDTPAVIRKYGSEMSADPRFEWQFLTAPSVRRLLPVLDDFGQDVSVDTDRRGQPTRVLHHMLKVFLIDPAVTVREIYSLAYLQPDVMFNDIRTLVMEADRTS
jgi:cytochrome oxidase Cu insertion factor (SCO1/SenC/PrrC family)